MPEQQTMRAALHAIFRSLLPLCTSKHLRDSIPQNALVPLEPEVTSPKSELILLKPEPFPSPKALTHPSPNPELIPLQSTNSSLSKPRTHPSLKPNLVPLQSRLPAHHSKHVLNHDVLAKQPTPQLKLILPRPAGAAPGPLRGTGWARPAFLGTLRGARVLAGPLQGRLHVPGGSGRQRPGIRYRRYVPLSCKRLPGSLFRARRILRLDSRAGRPVPRDERGAVPGVA
jgi:hypothetical protein